MRVLDTALVLGLALAAFPAAAQLSNHGIAVESGISRPLDGAGEAAASLALAASTWIEGDVEGVARVAFASASRTGGRAAVPGVLCTLGLRLSLGHAPVRPHLFADAGWARVGKGEATSDELVFGFGAGLEWFPAGDLSVGARTALRVVGGAPALDLVLALAGYF
jgi:hypothetical protein